VPTNPPNGQAYEPKRINGAFAPGSSGNPGGRFKRSPEALAGILHTASPKLLRKAIAMALAGDGIVMRALLDRLVPVARSRPITLPQPVPATPLEAIDVVIGATASGVITPEEAERLASLVRARAEVAEVAELRERLARLEALLAGRPKLVIEELELDP
jgi:hypothetical protein